MIVPMKKVSLITLGDKKAETLKKLRKLGIAHIEINEGSSEKLDKYNEQISLLERALFLVGKKASENQKQIDFSNALEIAKDIVLIEDEKNSFLSEIAALNAELERVKSWGDISLEGLNYLESNGINIELYEMPKSEYKNLCDNIKTIKLDEGKASVKFLLVNDQCDNKDKTDLKHYQFTLPHISTDIMRRRINQLNSQIEQIDNKIAYYSCYIESIISAKNNLQKDIEFEIYATGMQVENLSSEKSSSVAIAYFKCYVESENIEKLKLTAKENSWALFVEEPNVDDNVPTKLKNNKFVSLVYPLTDFMGTVPGYFEYDISGWFLTFILIFFGIIFGDGGYGIIISAIAVVPILKSLFNKKPISPVFILIGLFGLSTILWGTLTCTWFGIEPAQLPQWLKSLSIPVISNVYADKIWSLPWTADGVGLTTAQNLQIFCFSLALIQLSVAHIKVGVRNRKSLKILGDIGSILQLFGIFYLVLNLVVNAEVFSFSLMLGEISVGTLSILLIGIGFSLSFIFSNFEGNIIKSIVSSLTNIVSVLLGVVNVFSDIVSYIRLWAVALAGAAISATVNQLAGPLLGNFLFMILAIILLVFGHGLNMVLNVLSVIVHGIRLNTLEFSSHLDLTWSGHKFKPFKE